LSALADIFALARIKLDTGSFEADALRAADTVGASMSNRLSSKIKTALKGAIGAGIGLAVASGLNAANELDAATRQLQADTGMTADEAKRAETAIAGMYKNNLQGFDAIGAAMAKVHNDLGLTGAAADAATEKFLKFSTATGQDAAAAVTQADDTLDAFNLTADHSGELLDKLILSHQKYGGVISENEAALTAMAPALNAANLGLDDGIALLNLFNAAGVDAAKAPQALTKALGKIKSPEDLKRLIADITATKDPFERAQKAIDLFGAKAGPQLAQALAQGNLGDFTINMNDAAGATDKAAAAVESGFGAQATLLLHKFNGGLAEIGVNLGDLVVAASLLGPGLTKLLLGGLGGLAGLLKGRISGALVSAWSAAVSSSVVSGIIARGGSIAATLYLRALMVGDAIGSSLSSAWTNAAGVGSKATKAAGLAGRASGLAFQLGFVFAIAGLADAIEPSVNKAGQDVHDMLFGPNGPFSFAGKPLEDIGKWLENLPWPIGPKGAPDWAKGSSDAQAGAQSVADGVKAGFSGLDALPGKVADDLAPLAPTIGDLANMVGPLTDAQLALLRAWRDSARPALTLSKNAGDLADALERVKGYASGAAGALQDFEAAEFGGAIMAGNLADAQKGLADLLADPPKKGTREYKIWAGEVATAKQRIFDLQYQMAQAQGPKALYDWLEKQRSKLAANDKKGRDYLNTLIALASLNLPNVQGSLTVKITSGPYAGKSVPAFATGTPYVPADMLAFIHRGEMVVPAAQAEAVRAGVATVGGGGDTYHNTWVMPEPTRDPFAVLDATSRYIRWGRMKPQTEPVGG
jgi:hypothetical protein